MRVLRNFRVFKALHGSHIGLSGSRQRLCVVRRLSSAGVWFRSLVSQISILLGDLALLTHGLSVKSFGRIPHTRHVTNFPVRQTKFVFVPRHFHHLPSFLLFKGQLLWSADMSRNNAHMRGRIWSLDPVLHMGS